VTTPSDQLIDKWIAFGKDNGLPPEHIERGTQLLLKCIVDRDKWPDMGARYQSYLTMTYRDGEGLVYLCEVFSIRNTNLAARRLRTARKVLFQAIRAAL